MSDKNGSEGRIQWSRFFKKLSPYMIQKGLLYLKHYGPKGVLDTAARAL